MFTEDDLLPLSALQHLVFCPRQCALIHLEGIWDENVLTVEGHGLHEKTDQTGTECRGDVRIARGVRLRSLRLGLSGKADVVEFHSHPEGHCQPFPVEYKHGRPKTIRCDEVQLCAQALCLEEMLGFPIPGGALFYGQLRRRQEVVFDDPLRQTTEAAAQQLHDLFTARQTPSPEYGPKCESCSLRDHCLPQTIQRKQLVDAWVDHQLKAPEGNG